MSAKKSSSRYRLSREGDALSLSFRRGDNSLGCFMLIFLVAWSGGCAFLLTRVAAEPQLEHVLFAVPFCAGWLFVVAVVLQQYLGREWFRLDESGATLTVRHALLARTSFMPLDELVRFGTAEQSDETHDNQPARVLELRTIGRPLRFGAQTSADERRELMAELNRLLKELQKQRHSPPRVALEGKRLLFGKRFSGELLSDEALGAKSGDAPSLRTMNDPPIKPPHDTNWRRRDDFDSVSFTLRGRWTTGGVVGVALLNAFWSGIVGVFLLTLFTDNPDRPHGLEWVWRFIFLLPFELVGLVMFLGLLVVVAEPLRRYRWKFARDQITCSLTWLGLGPRWRYPVEHFDRLEVRLVPYDVPRFPQRLPLGSLWAPKGCPTYAVVFLDAQRRERLQIEGLTLGEACHWADTLLRERHEWFG